MENNRKSNSVIIINENSILNGNLSINELTSSELSTIDNLNLEHSEYSNMDDNKILQEYMELGKLLINNRKEVK